MDTIRDLFSYLKERKKWWFVPVLIGLALVAFFIYLSSSGVLGPFIYTLF